MKLKPFIQPSVFIVLALFFALLPINMGKNANQGIPIIGAIENSASAYTDEALLKVGGAYAISKIVNKSIAMIQRAEVSATPFGVGVTFAPGELLASASDAIDRVANALFIVLGILLVQKLLIGMFSFICLKCLVPISFVLLAIFHTCKIVYPSIPYLQNIRKLGLFTLRMALIVWLLFPVSALISTFLETSYLEAEYTQLEKALANDGEALKSNTEELNLQISKAQELKQEPVTPKESAKLEDENDEGFSQWMMGSFSETINKAKNAMGEFAGTFSLPNISGIATNARNYIDNMIDDLFIMLSIFVVTNILVPLGVYFIMLGIYRTLRQNIALPLQKMC